MGEGIFKVDAPNNVGNGPVQLDSGTTLAIKRGVALDLLATPTAGFATVKPYGEFMDIMETTRIPIAVLEMGSSVRNLKLDPADMNIRRALRQAAGNSTVILIAHRITTLMNADQIIVLDKGRIRERGTHSELLDMNGLYRRIYDLQTAGADL